MPSAVSVPASEELAASVGDPARLWAWARHEVEDPGRRALLLEFLWQLALILGVGIAVDLIARHYVRRGQRHLRPVVKPRSIGRIGLLLAHSGLELLPILAFAVAAYVVVAVIQPGSAVRLALLAIVSAVVIARTAFVLCRFLLSPFAPTLRLFPMGDETAAYLYIWAKRLISLAVYGYFVLQVAVLLGLPGSAYELALKILGLIWALLLAALILQSRDSIAKMILHGAQDREARLRNLTRLRRQFAHSWHVLALIYLLAVYVTWATDVPGGFTYLGRGTGLTILILILAWLALALLRAGFERFLVINQDLLGRYPMLEQRANRYLPLLRRVLAALIRIVAVLAILGAWQVDIGSILAGAAAREIIGRITTILLMLCGALAIWEIVDASISFYLERRDNNGSPIVTSARARTLLPLVRNALLIVISVLAGLVTIPVRARRQHRPAAGRRRGGRSRHRLRRPDLGQGRDHRGLHPVRGYGQCRRFHHGQQHQRHGGGDVDPHPEASRRRRHAAQHPLRHRDHRQQSVARLRLLHHRRRRGLSREHRRGDHGVARGLRGSDWRSPLSRRHIRRAGRSKGSIASPTTLSISWPESERERSARAPVGREFNRRMKIKFDERRDPILATAAGWAYAMAPASPATPVEALPSPGASRASEGPAPKPSS